MVHQAPLSSPTLLAWQSTSAVRPTAPSFTATKALSSLLGHLLAEPSTRDFCHRWARSATVSTNAVMEAFWSRMQVELLDRRRWSTRVELANAMFEYLEIFHNRKRRHSSLGMLTPVEFEARRRQPTTAA